MPIKGQTDTDIGLPPLIGRLNKGEEQETINGRTQFGKNLEGLFRFTPVPKDDAELLARFHEKYGGAIKFKSVKGVKEQYQEWPRTLHILLLHDTPEEAFPHGYYEWHQGHFDHICDGETISKKYDPRIRRMRLTEEPCPYFTGEKQRTDKNKGCTPLGTLSLLLPHLRRRGYVEFKTKSWYDCVNIGKTLIDTQRYLRTEVIPAAMALGVAYDFRLSTTPFVLTRRLVDISRPLPNGGSVRGPEWLCHLEILPEFYHRTQAMLETAEAVTQRVIVERQQRFLEDHWRNTGYEEEVNPQLSLTTEYEEAEIIEHVQTA